MSDILKGLVLFLVFSFNIYALPSSQRVLPAEDWTPFGEKKLTIEEHLVYLSLQAEDFLCSPSSFDSLSQKITPAECEFKLKKVPENNFVLNEFQLTKETDLTPTIKLKQTYNSIKVLIYPALNSEPLKVGDKKAKEVLVNLFSDNIMPSTFSYVVYLVKL